MIIRRRSFLAFLGGAAVTRPLAARVQRPVKLPTVGFLGPLAQPAMQEWTAAFVRRLREVGWIESRTVTIEYRYADGLSDRERLAADVVSGQAAL